MDDVLGKLSEKEVNHVVEELTSRVRRKQENHETSNHIERCKDYVKKNYRKKMLKLLSVMV